MSRVDFALFSAVLIVAVSSLPGCSETPKEQYERQLREAEGSMRHAVHSEHLVKLMAELRQLAYSRLPQELGDGAVTEARIEEIQQIAANLSAAARLIPDILSDVELAPEQEREFRRMTDEFAQRCRTFEELAGTLSKDRARSADELVAEFSAVRDSCDACHTRFRVLPRIQKE